MNVTCDPELATTLFNGGLPSLRKLCLEYVHTELLWRNMIELTPFVLVHTSSVSARQLLDFFESAPHFHNPNLWRPTWAVGV